MKTKERMADKLADEYVNNFGDGNDTLTQDWMYSAFVSGFAARGKLDAEIASEYTSCDFDDSAQWAAGQILCAIHDLESAKEDT